MSDRVEKLGNQVFELFGASAGAPDDQDVGRAADEALRALDAELERRAALSPDSANRLDHGEPAAGRGGRSA